MRTLSRKPEVCSNTVTSAPPSAAAGDSLILEKTRVLLQHGNLRAALRRRDGGKKSRRAAANDHHTVQAHARESVLAKARIFGTSRICTSSGGCSTAQTSAFRICRGVTRPRRLALARVAGTH